jgi:hypothetical protein
MTANGVLVPHVVVVDYQGNRARIAGPVRVTDALAQTFSVVGMTLVTGALDGYALRRAVEAEAAAPRSGDFMGDASAADLVAVHDRCKAAARLWRLRATGRGGVW